ncbi:MAG: hypothetical protein OHK0013_43540 [Sandaracinaceae bacterium]
MTSSGTVASPSKVSAQADPTASGSRSTATPQTSESRPLPTDDAKRRAQELLTRRLDASRARPSGHQASPPPPARSSPPVSGAPGAKQEVLRGLASSLKSAANLTGGLDPVARYVADARRSLADNDLASAVRKMRLAVAIAPDNAEVKAEHDRLARELAISLADNYAEQAAYEERHHKWSAAAASWIKVVEGRPNDVDCHWRAARALLESHGDVKQAVRLAQRAVELRPTHVFAVRTLGRAFMAAGMTLNARREFERALELDPKDEVTKALLKELKQG